MDGIKIKTHYCIFISGKSRDGYPAQTGNVIIDIGGVTIDIAIVSSHLWVNH